MSTLEWIAFVSNVVCVALVVFELAINWPIGVVGSATLLAFFWQSKLYAQVVLQAFYIVESIYGWWMWTRRNALTGRRIVHIRATPVTAAVKLAIAIILGTAILYPIFTRTDDPFPFWDSAITAASFVAEYMLCFKLVESWPLYLGCDFVSMITLALLKSWLIFATYSLFLALCVAGWMRWRRALPKPAPSLRPS